MNAAFCSEAVQYSERDLLLKHFKRLLCHLCARLLITDRVTMMRLECKPPLSCSDWTSHALQNTRGDAYET